MKKFLLLIFPLLMFCEVMKVSTPNNLPLDSRELYLDLLKKCLINSIYEDSGYRCAKGKHLAYDTTTRKKGEDWPSEAHTMIGLRRLENIYKLYDVKNGMIKNVLLINPFPAEVSGVAKLRLLPPWI